MRYSVVVLLAVSAGMVSSVTAEPVSFRKQVAQLLLDNCLACHGPKKAEGGYRIDAYERLIKAGDSDEVAVTPSKLDASELFRRIATDDESERMPLEGDPLPAEQIALIKQWIEEGAKFDGEDPKAALATIVPPPVHPSPPEVYANSMPITAITFSPDGSQLAVSGYHELTVWNPADGKLIKRVHNIGQRTHAITYSPDGKLLAVGGGTPGRLGETRIFNAENGELVRVLGSTSDVVLDVAFAPQGDRIAAGSADGVIRVFEVASGKSVQTITSHSDWVMAIAWSVDGARIASGSRDKTAKVFDSKTGELQVTFSGHGQPVKGVAFHPEGKEVFSAGTDKKVQRWKIEDGKKTADVGSFGEEVYKLTAGGGFLFTGSADKSARQYDRKSHKEVRKYEGHKDWVLSTAYHDGSKRLATGSFDGEVRVWNTEDGKIVVTLLAAPGLKLAAAEGS